MQPLAKDVALADEALLLAGLRAMPPTAEDTVLAKLRWYAAGGGISDRQWRDVQAVIRVNADALDMLYLQQWATNLGLDGLLVAVLRGERPAQKDAEGQQTEMF